MLRVRVHWDALGVLFEVLSPPKNVAICCDICGRTMYTVYPVVRSLRWLQILTAADKACSPTSVLHLLARMLWLLYSYSKKGLERGQGMTF